MSEIQQADLVKPVAPLEQSTVTTEPTDPIVPAEGATTGTTTTATATDLPKEEKVGKGEVKIEAHPVTEGILNYKGPGLKGLIFSKKYFWLSDEPVEHGRLATYLSGEKNKDIAHPNAAHATQTGKGLLFFAKRQEDRGHPQGILNLAEFSDLAKGNANDFSASVHGNKHLFQALTKADRDGWLVSIESQIPTFKTHRETLVPSSGFKGALEKFTKPTATTTPAQKKEKSKSRERVKEVVNKATGKDTAKDVKNEPKEVSSDAPVVAATPATAEPAITASTTVPETTGTTIPPTTTTADAIEPSAPTTTGVSKDHHAEEVAAAGVATGAAAVGTAGATRKDSSEDEKTKNKKSRSQSRGNKRSSIFGGLLGKKDDAEEKKAVKKEEKKEEKEIKAEEKAVKKEEKKEEKAEKEIEKEVEKAEKKAEKEEKKAEKATEKAVKQDEKASEAAAAATTTTAAAIEKKETKPAVTTPADVTKDTTPISANREKPAKRGSVFGGLFNKKDTTKPTTEEATPAVTAKEEPTVSSTAPQLDHPVAPASETTTENPAKIAAQTAAVTAPTSTTTTDATTAAKPTTAPTDKRRTSLFGGIGSKKEKRSGATSGDELTDGESKKPSGGFGNLLRKASRAQPKDKSATPATEPVPAVPSTKPAEPTEVPLPKETATETEATATTNGGTVADKVEDTILPNTVENATTDATKPVPATA